MRTATLNEQSTHSDLREWIYSRLILDPESGCLLWTMALDDKGYGRVNIDGRSRLVHTVTWDLDNGPVPDGLVLDHVRDRGCIHRHCASPAHLEPVTQAENLRRAQVIERLAEQRRAITHCPRNHAYDEANTYTWHGGRSCRTCKREDMRRYRAERKSAS